MNIVQYGLNTGLTDKYDTVGTLWYLTIALENVPFIVHLPLNHSDFPYSVMLVYQRVSTVSIARYSKYRKPGLRPGMVNGFNASHRKAQAEIEVEDGCSHLNECKRYEWIAMYVH